MPWALGFGVIGVRMADAWSPWSLTLVLAAAAALPLGIGLRAEGEPGPPVAALVLAGLGLVLLAIARLTDALGADGAFATAGSACGGLAAFALIAAAARRTAGAPILTLVAGLALAGAVLALVDWVWSPGHLGPYRWTLLALMVAFLAAHAQARERAPRDGVLLLDVAGLATLLLASTLSDDLVPLVFDGDSAAGTGWEAVVVLAGFGLGAFAAVERQAGPGYLAAATFAAWAVGVGTGSSVLWWPLILVLGGGLAIGAGLRPARPLPPEPAPPGGPGERVDLRR